MVSRSQFLRGDFGAGPPLRPPGALPEARFTELCSRCGDCLKACPEGILAKGSGGYPVVDFGRGACTLCGECAAACETGALESWAGLAPPWKLKARIGEQCLALNQVVCRTCGEQCQQGAIRFRPAETGVAAPELDLGACNGCGACYAPCPAAAISILSAG